MLSNLHFVKDVLKMDQGWASIHRKKDLFPLKPPLQQTMTLLQGPKDPVLPSLEYTVSGTEQSTTNSPTLPYYTPPKLH